MVEVDTATLLKAFCSKLHLMSFFHSLCCRFHFENLTAVNQFLPYSTRVDWSSRPMIMQGLHYLMQGRLSFVEIVIYCCLLEIRGLVRHKHVGHVGNFVISKDMLVCESQRWLQLATRTTKIILHFKRCIL